MAGPKRDCQTSGARHEGLLQREYEERTIREQMIRPYSRVVGMFFVLVFGGVLVSLFSLPAFLMIVFVGFKIAVDLVAHLKDHDPRRAA